MGFIQSRAELDAIEAQEADCRKAYRANRDNRDAYLKFLLWAEIADRAREDWHNAA